MKLYRAVSYDELLEVAIDRVFRPAPPSFQGKWMAETVHAAAEFGRLLYKLDGPPFHVIEIEVADNELYRLYHDPRRDRVAPAWFADWDLLHLLQFIREVENVPLEWPAG